MFATNKYINKLGLSWAKLKFSLVRIDDEVTVIFIGGEEKSTYK